MAKKSKQQNTLITFIVSAIAVVVAAFAAAKGIIKVPIENSSTADGNSNSTVHFIDVGQGDATLVISEGHAALIDTGNPDNMDKVIKYMKNQGVTRLDYLIITHPHADHMGEANDIVESFDPYKIIIPKVPYRLTPTGVFYKRFLESVKNKNKKITEAKNTTLDLGKCKLRIYAPQKKYDDLNNYSSLVKVDTGKKTFLITGDCENEEEKEILGREYDIKADVLKVGHHGSSTSTSDKFLEAADPQEAVISCGKYNSYGHPNKGTVQRINKKVKKLYITMNNGTIIYNADGSVKTER